MHAARRSFVESESSEKIRRALQHQIQSAFPQKYTNGDLVYFKRNESEKWMGYIIFIVGSNGKYFPVHWQSKRIRRVVKSTQAAETLALVDLTEACIYNKTFLCEILRIDDLSKIPIVCKTNNSGVHSATHSTNLILDKMLRVETAILREMQPKNEIEEIIWIFQEHLTTRSLSPPQIMRCMAGHEREKRKRREKC